MESESAAYRKKMLSDGAGIQQLRWMKSKFSIGSRDERAIGSARRLCMDWRVLRVWRHDVRICGIHTTAAGNCRGCVVDAQPERACRLAAAGTSGGGVIRCSVSSVDAGVGRMV